MNITVSLNSGLGASLGTNFTLAANTGTISPTGATKSQLLIGVTCTVDDTVTGITICSLGVCTNCITIPITYVTTTTTTTTTVEPEYYLVDRYICESCGLFDTAVPVSSAWSLTAGNWYRLTGGFTAYYAGTRTSTSPVDSIFSPTSSGTCVGLPCL